MDESTCFDDAVEEEAKTTSLQPAQIPIIVTTDSSPVPMMPNFENIPSYTASFNS